MIRISERDYPTVSDVKKDFSVSVKAIRDWIKKGIIPRPPQIAYGARLVDIFPPEYVEDAKNKLKEYRERKLKQKI